MTNEERAETLAYDLFIVGGLYQRAGVYPPIIPKARIRAITEVLDAACAEAAAAEREACAAVAETSCLVVDEGATLTAGQAEDMARQLAARIALTIRRRPDARTPPPGGGTTGEEA